MSGNLSWQKIDAGRTKGKNRNSMKNTKLLEYSLSKQTLVRAVPTLKHFGLGSFQALA
jgi:hypothetical protein